MNEEGTSGFFSGHEMANIRNALNVLDRSNAMSKLYMTNQENGGVAQSQKMSLPQVSAYDSQMNQQQASLDSTPGLRRGSASEKSYAK